MELRVTPYDHPDAASLIDELQQEYVERYGGVDRTPVRPEEFAPPRGVFLVGYLDGQPVACGGWRGVDSADLNPGDVEIKRMYVLVSMRGRGLSRIVLGELERLATEAGHERLVLESGQAQPEALSLYRSAGYARIPSFGLHRDEELSVCMAKPLQTREAYPASIVRIGDL